MGICCGSGGFKVIILVLGDGQSHGSSGKQGRKLLWFSGKEIKVGNLYVSGEETGVW